MSKKTKHDRLWIRTVAQHSNWTASGIQQFLSREIYAKQEDWHKFISVFLLALGIGLTCAGVIFFFAYNWYDMHKFVKLGIVQGLFIVSLLAWFKFRSVKILNETLLLASLILIGTTIAVFGQIYQTGANAYDFFLAWTLFSVFYFVASASPFVWLLCLTLALTTLNLYAEQVTRSWEDEFVYFLSSLFLFIVVFLLLFFRKFKKVECMPLWFLRMVCIGAFYFLTVSIIFSLFDYEDSSFAGIDFLVLLFFSSVLLWMGYQERDIFFLAVVPFNFIIVIASFILKAFSDEMTGGFFFAGAVVVGGVSALISYLIKFSKHGKN